MQLFEVLILELANFNILECFNIMKVETCDLVCEKLSRVSHSLETTNLF